MKTWLVLGTAFVQNDNIRRQVIAESSGLYVGKQRFVLPTTSYLLK